MNTNRITVRYARALTETAYKVNLQNAVYSDMHLLLKTFEEFPKFKAFIEAPGMLAKTKIERIKEVFGDQLNGLTFRFLTLIFERNRDPYLQMIARNVIAFTNETENQTEATLEVAHRLDPHSLERLKSELSRKTGKRIFIKEIENKLLLGGFAITIDGIRYDASLASKLETMKKQLKKI